MRFILTTLILICTSTAFAQEQKAEVTTGHGYFYFGFGTNLSWYSKSDVRLKSSSFDFTLYDVKAKDDGGLKFNGGGAPQYTYQVGYYWKKKNFGVEFNFDHFKYFATPGQRVGISGNINGAKVQGDTTLSPDFVKLEHSDGANYALFSFVKMKNLYSALNKKSSLNLIGKVGLGPVFPKTNTTILGIRYDEKYAVSGWVTALELGLRYTFLKNFYVLPSFKGAYANYNNFYIHDGTGSQRWFSGHFVIVAGGQINIGK